MQPFIFVVLLVLFNKFNHVHARRQGSMECSLPLDLMLLLDESCSVSNFGYNNIIVPFTQNLVNNFFIEGEFGTKVGVQAFSGANGATGIAENAPVGTYCSGIGKPGVRVIVPGLNGDKTSIINTLSSHVMNPPSCRSGMGLQIRMSKDVFDNQGRGSIMIDGAMEKVQKVALLMTDGAPYCDNPDYPVCSITNPEGTCPNNGGPDYAYKQADIFKDAGYKMYVMEWEIKSPGVNKYIASKDATGHSYIWEIPTISQAYFDVEFLDTICIEVHTVTPQTACLVNKAIQVNMTGRAFIDWGNITVRFRNNQLLSEEYFFPGYTLGGNNTVFAFDLLPDTPDGEYNLSVSVDGHHFSVSTILFNVTHCAVEETIEETLDETDDFASEETIEETLDETDDFAGEETIEDTNGDLSDTHTASARGENISWIVVGTVVSALISVIVIVILLVIVLRLLIQIFWKREKKNASDEITKKELDNQQSIEKKSEGTIQEGSVEMKSSGAAKTAEKEEIQNKNEPKLEDITDSDTTESVEASSSDHDTSTE